MGLHSSLNRRHGKTIDEAVAAGTLTPAEAERRSFIQIAIQKGHIAEVGVNGCFMQDVVEMLIEQIDDYDDERPDLACRENSLARTKLEEAWSNLELRKQARMRAGVLSTYLPIPRPT